MNAGGGDAPCADRDIARRTPHMASLDPEGAVTGDDIAYSRVGHPSLDTHPRSPNSWRNGRTIGEEPPATG